MSKEQKNGSIKEETVGDFDFDLVFKKPHLTPDSPRKEHIKENKERMRIMRKKMKPLPKMMPDIPSQEEFLANLDKKDSKVGGKKISKRKTRRQRKTKRKGGGKRRTKKKARKHKKRKTLKRKH